ncbi:phosphoribosylglycinamide formyltransferase [Corynebacterium auriscanis]|uniref:phosphoribosylglycinamide formyltransferase n=1 Tax=Corynebacterium auriscanis TaxID=99807 RepID=UPI0024ACB59D|nr:phosphoribosylglycinamide formyltransferase [Corynebacterium auriscanis]
MRIVMLASGSGTLLQSVIDNVEPDLVDIAAVGADRECEALQRANRAGIDTFLVNYEPGNTDRGQWDAELTKRIQEYAPDLVVSAGFMRIIGKETVAHFAGKIINTHPALLPAFPGAHAVEDALNYGVRVTGSTVHVVDSGVDTGPIIAQHAVSVHDDDSVETLHENIKKVERELLVDVLHNIARHGLTIEGRKARIS